MAHPNKRPPYKPGAPRLSDAELIRWAIDEIRGLDELCRGQVPAYWPLQSDDMVKIKDLTDLAERAEKWAAAKDSKK